MEKKDVLHEPLALTPEDLLLFWHLACEIRSRNPNLFCFLTYLISSGLPVEMEVPEEFRNKRTIDFTINVKPISREACEPNKESNSESDGSSNKPEGPSKEPEGLFKEPEKISDKPESPVSDDGAEGKPDFKSGITEGSNGCPGQRFPLPSSPSSSSPHTPLHHHPPTPLTLQTPLSLSSEFSSSRTSDIHRDENNPDVDERGGGAEGEGSNEDFVTIKQAWNSLPPPFAKVWRLTQQRKRVLRCRLADKSWRAHWREALRQLPDVPFLRGINDRGWVATFDWFIRPDSVTRLIEGVYVHLGRQMRKEAEEEATKRIQERVDKELEEERRRAEEAALRAKDEVDGHAEFDENWLREDSGEEAADDPF